MNLLKLLLCLGLLFIQSVYAEDAHRELLNSRPIAKELLVTDEAKVSYAMGLNVGKALKDKQIQIDEKAFFQGIKDGLSGKKPLIPTNTLQALLIDFHKKQVDKMAEERLHLAKENKKAGEEFLAANAKKAGVITLPSGLQYKVLHEGKGESPTAKDTVLVNYEGKLINGKVFDSSYQRNKPISFKVSNVIAGWTEALKLMKPDSTWMLYIPAKLAYKNHRAGEIAPGSTLIFKVHLISVEGK